MKPAIFHVAATAIFLLAAAGCGNGSSGQDVLDDVTVLDAAGDVGGGDIAADTAGGDIQGTDVAADPGQGDTAGQDTIPPDDTPMPDAQDDVTNPDECAVHQECPDCQLCLDSDGQGKKCTEVLWEQGECYEDEDCLTEGGVCRFSIPGKPECGGSCWPDAVYTLHEWGVNTVTPAGDGAAHGGPLRYYDSMDRKPVIYIYSDEQFSMDLGVEYRTGTSVETWPEIPDSAHVVWKDIAVGTTGCTTTPTPAIDWTGEIPAQEVWDLPNWVVDGANCLTVGETVSKVLFYAGPFTDYVPGVQALLTRVDTLTGTISLTNNMADEIGPVIVVYRDAESSCAYFGFCPVHTATIGWKIVESVAAGATAIESLEWDYEHVDATVEDPNPSVDGLLPAGWTDLPAALRGALTAKGLTTDEADRFMAAWTDTMFGLHGADADPLYPEYRQGAAVIYLWPDSRTNEKLPLTAVPVPTTTVRAMVEYQQVETVELL